MQAVDQSDISTRQHFTDSLSASQPIFSNRQQFPQQQKFCLRIPSILPCCWMVHPPHFSDLEDFVCRMGPLPLPHHLTPASLLNSLANKSGNSPSKDNVLTDKKQHQLTQHRNLVKKYFSQIKQKKNTF